MKSKGTGKIIALYLLFFVVIIVIANAVHSNNTKVEEVDYSQVVTMFQKEEVKRYYIDNAGTLYISKNTDEGKADGTKVDLSSFEYVHNLADIEQFRSDLGDLIFEQTSKGTLVKYDYQAAETIPWWAAYLPYAIVIIALVPAPTQIIITGPKAILGRLFNTTKNGSDTFDKNLEDHKIMAIIIPKAVPDKKPTIVS